MRFTMRDGRNTLGYGVVTEKLDSVNLEKFAETRKVEKKARLKEERAKEAEAEA